MDNALFEKYGLHPVELLTETRQVAMWKMIQPAISRSVVVHVLKPELTSDPESTAYIFSVIRAVADVNGPALADVYTIVNEPDLKAVVSEYVEGLTLEAAVAALGPLSPRQVLRTGAAIVESLAALWNSAHIIHGGVRAAFITLDAGSTAKLVSPCFARVASADETIPVADMADLGNLLYFLTTGVKPGQATTASIPVPFLQILDRLVSESVMTRYTCWENVLQDLRRLDSANNAAPVIATPTPPAARAPSAGQRRRLAIRKEAPAPANIGAKPAAAPHPAALHTVRKTAAPTDDGATPSSPAAPRAFVAARNSLDAVRQAATEKAAKAESEASTPVPKLFAVALLVLFLTGLFCYRIAMLEPVSKYTVDDTAAVVQPSPLSSDLVAMPEEPAGTIAAAVSAPAETVAAPEPTTADEPAADTPAPANEAEPDDDAKPDADTAMNHYLAAHVGQEIPFLYKGEPRPVTLVSYDAVSVTVKTKKTLTISRASLSDEQRALWK